MPPSIIAFADGEVGSHCVQWLARFYRDDLTAIITTSRNDIYWLALEAGLCAHEFGNEESCLQLLASHAGTIDLGLLLWWPTLISPQLIDVASHGFINTHPSLLPYNRGKHYNFWALVEQCPFGVSLHVVDQGIDCGSVVAQSSIDYTWEDTGETLYDKATTEMKALFEKSYPSLRSLTFTSAVQDLSLGSIHYASELGPASTIQLDEPTTARRLLNLLRARTFAGHPACTFVDGGIEYEARIKITKRK